MKWNTWTVLVLGALTISRLLRPSVPFGHRLVWRHLLDGQLYDRPGPLGIGAWTAIRDGTPFYNHAAPW